MKKQINIAVEKVDAEHGLVIGYAIVCEEFKLAKADDAAPSWVPYFDVQGDHIPEDAMLAASTDFMLHSRVGKGMHAGEQIADVVFAFPVTKDIAEALGWEVRKTGLAIAWKPASQEILDNFKSGKWTGFSIGGERGEDEEV